MVEPREPIVGVVSARDVLDVLVEYVEASV